MFLAFDTSNYTTSAALFGSECQKNISRLLDVKPGELGLRQSDALFHHVQRLPDIIDRLFEGTDRKKIRAVAASTRPRAVEGSYMPCFLAGETVARSLAKVLDVPFYAFSHQQGHIAASVWSSGRMDLLQKPHLAWHLSGGTTELLLVHPNNGKNVCAERIGGTTDISAGQVIDRAGKLLSLQFPSGKALDELAFQAVHKEKFSVKLRELSFSFSGLENKVNEYFNKGASKEETAAYAVNSVTDAIVRTTREAMKAYPGLEVVFSGGVASNRTLRQKCAEFSPVFAKPEFSTDNAMGVAVLCSMQEEP